MRLGRFCYWHDDDEIDVPSEPPWIERARLRLSERLARAATLLPGDAWIAGQHVRYLVESKRFADALGAADACRADRSWCLALSGFTLHVEGNARPAGVAFTGALASMPDDERCAWEDVTVLLPPRTGRRYRSLDCTARRQLADTLWWLADPLWTREGNDRWSEHMARMMMSCLERESRSPYDMGWGPDTHELIVRYGWPTKWTRDWTTSMRGTDISVVGHEPHPAFEFLPADTAMAAALLVPPAAWTLRQDDARSRFAPPYARVFAPLDVQFVRLPRGDSLQLIVVADVAGDTILQDPAVRGGLALARSPDGVSQIVEGRRAGGRFHFTLATPNTPLIASVELTDSVKREAARRREGLRALLPTDGRGTVLSDVLLYEAPRDADARLEDVLARALGSSEVTRGSRIGAYWELQRTRARADTVTYTLTVMPKAAGWLRRLAGRVGLAERTAPVHMRFSEPLGDEVRTFRALALDVSRLGTGRYDVRLRAETGHGEWGESEREIRVVR